jgi:hypothetical protein
MMFSSLVAVKLSGKSEAKEAAGNRAKASMIRFVFMVIPSFESMIYVLN